MKRNTFSTLPRIAPDFAMILAAIGLSLLTAYWLINQGLAVIYAVCLGYAAIAALFVSTSWLKNVTVLFSALILALLVAELVLTSLGPGKVANFTKKYSPSLRENGGELGYRPFAARKVQASKTSGNEAVYDVLYTINEQGYRETPGIDDANGESSIVFFGGSFAFGEGLNDNQTLPYFVAAETDYRRPVLNLAFSGYGPHQMLRSLELGRLQALGQQSIKTVIYTAIPDHARRSVGEAWWDPVGPRYAFDGTGSIHYEGRFSDIPDALAAPYYFYRQAAKVARRSAVIDRTANLLFPEKTIEQKAKAELLVEIVSKSSAILESDYGAELIVLFWDDPSEISTLILGGLAQKNIRTIKVSDIIPRTEQMAYLIPNDGHPSAAANERIARELAAQLGDLH